MLHLLALVVFHPIRTAVTYTTVVCALFAAAIWLHITEERT